MRKEKNTGLKASILKYSASIIALALSVSLVLLPMSNVITVSAEEVAQGEIENNEIEELQDGKIIEEEENEVPLEIETFSLEPNEPEVETYQLDPTDLENPAPEDTDDSGTDTGEIGESDENLVVGTSVETIEEIIPFETEYVDDSTLPEGEERVSQEGVNGTFFQTIQTITYEDGTTKKTVTEERTEEPTPQIVLIGTLVIEEPTPEPDPVEPTPEAPEPEEPTTEETTPEPELQVNPIFPNAQIISGAANPSANVVVFYPGSDRQRSATVNSNGYWSVRNIAGDASYLTEGSTVPMLLIFNGEEHYYDDQFYVQPASTTPDNYAAPVVASDESATENQSIDERSSIENSSDENLLSSSQSETLELLPETGEAKDVDFLGYASLASGLGLMVVGKKSKIKETE